MFSVAKKKQKDSQPDSKSYAYPLIIIGSGVSALNAAVRASKNNFEPVIIADKPLGEDFYNAVVPLAAFIEGSKTQSTKPKLIKYVKDCALNAKKHIEKKTLDDLAVKIITGEPTFEDANTVTVKTKKTALTVDAKRIIIAKEAEPDIPEIQGLEKIEYFTYKNLLEIKKIPAHVLILGAGIFGLQMADALMNLGVKVTIVSKAFLPFAEPECAEKMYANIIGEKVTYLDNELKKIEKKGTKLLATTLDNDIIEADMLLIATGKVGNITDLNLEQANVSYENGCILVDNFLRTSQKNIHAAGGSVQFRSEYQIEEKDGILAANNSTYDIAAQKCDQFYCWGLSVGLPMAQVGAIEKVADQIFKGPVDIFTVDLNDYPSSTYIENPNQFLKIILYKNKIVGASIVSRNALEIVGVLSFAVQNKLSLVELSSLTPPGLGHLDDLFRALSDIAYEKHKNSLNYRISNWAGKSFFLKLFGKILRR